MTPAEPRIDAPRVW
jgi:hypothetical protein